MHQHHHLLAASSADRMAHSCMKSTFLMHAGSVLADAQVVAGIPAYFQELLNVKVAHFEPVAVSLVGQGVYPALALTLPRARNEEYDQALFEAQDLLRAAQLRPQPLPRYIPGKLLLDTCVPAVIVMWWRQSVP